MTLETVIQKHRKSLSIKFLSLKKVENIVANGEIARFEQFLFLLQCFQKSSAAGASKSVYIRERVNRLCCPFQQPTHFDADNLRKRFF